MAKKISSHPEQIPDALITDKATFTSTLLDRIEKGKEIINVSVTNTEELKKNEADYYRWDNYNSEYLKQSFNNEQSQYKKEYDNVNYYSNMFGGPSSPAEELKQLKKDIGKKVEYLEQLVEKIPLLKSAVEAKQPVKVQTALGKINNNIFIVHGHNTSVQLNVARTIEKLGLTPIILHEQANAGKTLIEKFESNSNVGFAIVLLTDDDEGKSKTEIDLKSRARQNVVLELGYFIGKLNRDKVLPLYSEGVELPSDIHGLLYVPLDKAETWKFALVRELKAAGYSVDANLLI